MAMAATAAPVQAHAPHDVSDRISGCLLAMCAGDALAMPLHWYYSYPDLAEHVKTHYSKPANGALANDRDAIMSYYSVPEGLKHPSSWKYYSRINPSEFKIDIFHDDADLYDVEGSHYHPKLNPGQNTTTTQIALRLADSLSKSNQYDVDDFLKRYIDYFKVPGTNPDTYVEEIHRVFFKNLGEGVDPKECGTCEDSCLAALTIAFPLILKGVVSGKSLDEVHTDAVAHVGLFTASPTLTRRLRVITWLVGQLLSPERPNPIVALRRAFEVLTVNQDPQVYNLDVLLLEDDTDLFWGSSRDALGKSEKGEDRGGSKSVFSIS